MSLLTADELSALRIERVVLHQVGPRDSDFKIFDGEVDPGDLETFFIERLLVANKGSRYEFEGTSEVLSALRAVEVDGTALIERGAMLATHFNEQHRGNTNSGTFAIFVLACEMRRLYAVIKFDHRPTVDVDDSAARAQLRLLKKTIVESPDAMQKSAIIGLTAAGGELAVRDRRGPGSIPAYFLRFLGVKRRFTESELTKKLAAVVKNVAAENEENLSPAFLVNLPTRIYHTVQNLETFDSASDDVVTAVFGAQVPDSPIRAAFAAQLREAGIEDEHFELDKAAIPRPTRDRLVTVEGIEINYGETMRDRVSEIPLGNGEIEIRIRTAGVSKREQLP